MLLLQLHLLIVHNNGLVVLARLAQLRRVELLQALLLLQVLVKSGQFRSDREDVLHFLH